MSQGEIDGDADRMGYGKPPQQNRFQKGRSGNPRGRPKGRRSSIPYNNVLGQMVTIREDGRERRVTAAEAFLLHLTRKGLAGDSAAARASLAAIGAARTKRSPVEGITIITMVAVSMGIEGPIDDLGIATVKYPFDETRTRWALNPWIVEEALARFGQRRLTVGEQREVYGCTRTPAKVAWPEWWTERQ